MVILMRSVMISVLISLVSGPQCLQPLDLVLLSPGPPLTLLQGCLELQDLGSRALLELLQTLLQAAGLGPRLVLHRGHSQLEC